MNKICIKCKKEKDENSFEKRKDIKKGKIYTYFRPVCKICRKRVVPPRIVKESNIRYGFDIDKTRVLEKLPIPHRCDNELCRMIIPNIKYCRMSVLSGKKKYYCDEFCFEQGEVDKLKQEKKCKYCDNFVDPILRKDGRLSGMYKKVCDDCRVKRKEESRLRSITRKRNRRKEKDLIGHICWSCKIYKTWDKFPSQKNGSQYRCKECANEAHRVWASNNKQHLRDYINKYNKKKRLSRLTNN